MTLSTYSGSINRCFLATSSMVSVSAETMYNSSGSRPRTTIASKKKSGRRFSSGFVGLLRDSIRALDGHILGRNHQREVTAIARHVEDPHSEVSAQDAQHLRLADDDVAATTRKILLQRPLRS